MPARSLQPVPELAPRVLGMIRVSKDRDGKTISPEIQRVAIAEYCKGRGYEITGWLEGIDESGSRAKSAWWPRLDQAVGWVEDGTYDVIVVWEFSRAARHRLRWNVAIDRVETAGGRLESATERVDVSTASGRFQRGVLTEMHSYRAEQIGEGWKSAQGNRVSKGLTHNGKPRAGYLYDRELKMHVPDPDMGPELADCYRRYIAGTGFYTLAGDLNRRGLRTTTGGHWRDGSLRRAMDSGFAAGLVKYHGELHQGAHEPIIDEQTWQAYLDTRHGRSREPSRRVSSPYVLSGLVLCASCGASMNGGTFGKQRIPKYRCERGRATAHTACPGGYISAALVEEGVLEWLRALAREVDAGAQTEDPGLDLRAMNERSAARLARKEAQLEAALVRMVQQQAADPVPESVYRQAREGLQADLEQVTTSRLQAEREARVHDRPVAAIAAPLLEEWDELQVPVRRATLAGVVGAVLVRTRAAGGPAVVAIVPTWELAPAGGGYAGVHDGKRPNAHHGVQPVVREDRSH